MSKADETLRERDDATVGHRTVSHASITAFGALTGDYSRIHFDAGHGREVGYGGPIAHGLLTACWAVGALNLYASERVAIGDPNAFQSGFSVRLSKVVHAEDTFALRVLDPGESPQPPDENESSATTHFETLNQRDERTTSGHLTISHGLPNALGAAPESWSLDRWRAPETSDVLYADDLVEVGPRGECLGRTLTEADIVNFTGLVGELNPLYLDQEFARKSIFGARVAPPMLTFCLAFSDFLRDFLTARMASRGFAGHLGDHWRWLAPIHPGDTLRTRHKPIGSQRSRSQPDMGIVRFGIQIVNQRDEIVQDGETIMMIPAGPSA